MSVFKVFGIIVISFLFLMSIGNTLIINFAAMQLSGSDLSL